MEFLIFLTYVIQVLAVVILAVLMLGLLYLVSETARGMVESFELWALKRRIKKKLKSGKVRVLENDQAIFELKNRVTPEEALAIREMFGRNKHLHATIFDEVAADHHVDPKDVIRSAKEQEAQDQETVDRATEYRNDIG